jgi:hypothetical protein
MIFIDVDGRIKTKVDTILDIIDSLEFNEIRKIKKLTTQKKYQIGIFLNNVPFCFLNFDKDESRNVFYQKLKMEFNEEIINFTESM